jgi:Tol biopolymer transport system component
MTLERGTLLHKRYRIVEILGQGGMGSVYRAVDENLGVDVALKENLFTTDEYARQFRLEAVILANLRHPNLPRVSDHFVVGDQGQYLVMDYIEGEDLRQRMERQGAITEDEAVQIGAAMCDALAYLHTRKPPILHRDLKPGNVKITPDGHIFLVDFGLAKVVQGSQATTTGARAMTPGYSPPEQYGTARTDPRTDVYSLGATLYASLCGVIPEDGLARAMDNAQLTPLRKRNPKISKRLSQTIEKAMSVDPAERYQNADDFKRALLGSKSKTQRGAGDYIVAPPPPEGEGGESGKDAPPRKTGPGIVPPPEQALEDQPFKPPKSQKRSRRGCFVFIALALLLTAALVTAWFRLPSFPEQMNSLISLLIHTPTASVSPEAPTDAPLPSETAGAPVKVTFTPTFTLIPHTPTALPTLTPTLTFTPSPTPMGGNGQYVFASERTGVSQIYLADLADGTTARPLTNMTEGACQPSWSPDGARIVFTSPCKNRGTDLKNSSIYTMNADGSNAAPLSSESGGGYDPAWSPEGNRVAFVSTREGAPQVFIYDLTTSTISRLTEPSNEVDDVREPAWSPLGNQLAYAAMRFGVYQIWAVSDTGQGQTQLSASGPDIWDRQPAWSPDASIILFSQRNVSVYSNYHLMRVRYEERNAAATRLNFGPLPIENVSFSPDGFWIIFEGEDVDENTDIFIMTADGGNRTRLTSDPGADFDPAWRPTPIP